MCTDLGTKLGLPQQKASVEPQDLTNKYNTPLSATEEAAYQKWAKDNNKLKDTYDYDLRGFWKNKEAFAENGHGTDRYKKPNHPTFSDQSMYNGVDGNQGGTWAKQTNGSYVFNASETNVKNMGEQGLQQYFSKYEKGNAVNLPKKRN